MNCLLIGKVIEGIEWEEVLKFVFKGMNLWFFVYMEEIFGVLKFYCDLQKELKLENYFIGVVFEGKFYIFD